MRSGGNDVLVVRQGLMLERRKWDEVGSGRPETSPRRAARRKDLPVQAS